MPTKATKSSRYLRAGGTTLKKLYSSKETQVQALMRKGTAAEARQDRERCSPYVSNTLPLRSEKPGPTTRCSTQRGGRAGAGWDAPPLPPD